MKVPTQFRRGNLISFLTAFLLLFFSYCSTYAQSEYKNNAIYTSVGTVYLQSQISIAYERNLYSKNHLRIRAKIHYGRFSADGFDRLDEGRKLKNHKGISGVFLFQLFEFSAGVVFTNYTIDPGEIADPEIDYTKVLNGVSQYVATGLRYEKDNFLLRAGLSNMEYLYAGIGICF